MRDSWRLQSRSGPGVPRETRGHWSGCPAHGPEKSSRLREALNHCDTALDGLHPGVDIDMKHGEPLIKVSPPTLRRSRPDRSGLHRSGAPPFAGKGSSQATLTAGPFWDAGSGGIARSNSASNPRSNTPVADKLSPDGLSGATNVHRDALLRGAPHLKGFAQRSLPQPYRSARPEGISMPSRSVKAAATLLSVLSTTLIAAPTAHSATRLVTLDVACSETALVNAINQANTDGGGTLNLRRGCTYTLTTPSGGPSVGLPTVTTPITINGRSAIITRAATAPVFGILVVTATGDLTLNNTTLSGGDAFAGGGVFNRGRLTVRNSTIRENNSSIGGAITNVGTLRVIASALRNNRAIEGGAISNQGSSAQATISLSTIANNTATSQGGGIVNAASMAIRASKTTGNTAGPGGSAGIYNGLTGNLDCNGCIIDSNRTTGPGGGFASGPTSAAAAFTNSTITRNVASDGGGIYKTAGSVTLARTVVGANRPNNCAPVNSVAGCFR